MRGRLKPKFERSERRESVKPRFLGRNLFCRLGRRACAPIFVLWSAVSILSSRKSPISAPGMKTVDCGFTGIGRIDCEKSGCHFSRDGSCIATIDVRRGFLSTFDFTCSSVDKPYSNPSSCGYPGISRAECLNTGCCFDFTLGCFFPEADMSDLPAKDHEILRWSTMSQAYPRRSTYQAMHLTRENHPEVTFSVILCCYGKDSTYVSDAINSVLKQSFPGWELIVVDDGSPMKSCAEAARQHLESLNLELGNKIKILTKSNGFISDARNFGISHASANYILPLDADDYLSPNFLLESTKIMEKEAHVDLFYADQLFFGKRGSSYWWYLWPSVSWEEAKKRGPLPVTTIFSKRLFNHVKGFKIDMIYGNEDYDFWLSLLQSQIITRKVKGISSWYRMKPESMHDDRGYKTMAHHMLRAHQPYVFSDSDVYVGHANVLCRLSKPSEAQRLQEAIEKQPFSCPGWLWLAFYNLAQRCSNPSQKILIEGIQKCRGTGSTETDPVNTSTLPLWIFLRWLLSNAPGKQHILKSRDLCVLGHETECQICVQDVLHYTGFSDPELVDFEPREVMNVLSFLSENKEHSSASVVEKLTPSFKKLKEMLSSADRAALSHHIPRIIHFVYGLENHPVMLEMLHYAAIRTAMDTNPNFVVYFHSFYAPTGQWWDAISEKLTLILHTPFNEFKDRCVPHYAHKADLLRLKILHDYGGVYLDIDIISLRSWEGYTSGHDFIMAWQDSPSEGTVREGKRYGLCNAAMASSKFSFFSKLWLSSYEHFRSYGRDRHWDEHSVILPANMSEYFPWLQATKHLSLLDSKRMWDPLWDEVSLRLLSWSSKDLKSEFSESLLVHLWRGGSQEQDPFMELSKKCGWLKWTPLGRLVSKYVHCNRKWWSSQAIFTPL